MDHNRIVTGYRLSFSLLDGFRLGAGFWAAGAVVVAVIWLVHLVVTG